MEMRQPLGGPYVSAEMPAEMSRHNALDFAIAVGEGLKRGTGRWKEN